MHRPTPHGIHNQICHSARPLRGAEEGRIAVIESVCFASRGPTPCGWLSRQRKTVNLCIYIFFNNFTHNACGCTVGVLVCSVCPWPPFRATVVSCLPATKDFLQIRWENWCFGCRRQKSADQRYKGVVCMKVSFVFGRTDCVLVSKKQCGFIFSLLFFFSSVQTILVKGSIASFHMDQTPAIAVLQMSNIRSFGAVKLLDYIISF